MRRTGSPLYDNRLACLTPNGRKWFLGHLRRRAPRATDLPLPRNAAKGRVLELFGVGDGIAELAVFVEATGEEVVEQTSAHLLELRNHRLRLRNRLVHRVQHRRDARLLV